MTDPSDPPLSHLKDLEWAGATSSGPDEGSPPLGSAAARPAKSRVAWTVLKVAVTALLVSMIARRVDWPAFRATLGDLHWGLTAVVLALHGVGLTISSEKWRQLLVIHGARVRIWLLVRWYLIAGFANQFLPSSIGGDAYRILKTWRPAGGGGKATLTILEERISGLGALLLLGYGLSIPGYGSPREPLLDRVAEGGTAALGVGVLLLVALWGLARHPRTALPRRLSRLVAPILRNVEDFNGHRARSALVALISVLFHINKILAVWMLLLALGQSVSFVHVAVGVMAVEVIGLVPISLGGLGLMEGSFMVVMGEFGLDPATALAAMLLLRASLLPLVALGALLYLTGDKTAPARS